VPYIERKLRERVWDNYSVETPGELNYKITIDINEYLQHHGVSYTKINEVIGVLECAKLELYRRIAAPYEDKKKEENGDVYTVQG
jgi:hypothetical protein